MYDKNWAKREASPSFRDGPYIQQVMEKAYESDQKEKWIDLA